MTVRKYQNPIINYIGHTLKNYNLALEFTQEVFIKAYKSLHTFNPRYKFKTWLYKIASNHIIDHWRKKKTEYLSLDHPFKENETFTPPQIESDERPAYKELELKEMGKKIDKALDLPRQITYASDQIKKSFGPVIGIGLLSLIIFIALCLFSALLSLLIIGIPILLSLILLAVVFKVFGNVVLFHFAGNSLSKSLGSKHPSLILSIFWGFILITLLTCIPVFGPVLSFFLTATAWGVAIRTKFGTTENWFQRKNSEKIKT